MEKAELHIQSEHIRNNFIRYEKEIRNTSDLSKFFDLNSKNYKIDSKAEGVYSFWFDNRDSLLVELDRNPKIKGPNNNDEEVNWNWNLNESLVCMYVGKTRDFRKRLPLHLLTNTRDNLYKKDATHLFKKTTSCQLRTGFDFLYKSKSVDIIVEIQNRIKVSFVKITSFIERFYFEDYCVGKMVPWFNVDSER